MDSKATPTNQPKQPVDELAQWHAEEANRVNTLAEAARKMGIVVPTGCGVPPQLNPDGSLALAQKKLA